MSEIKITQVKVSEGKRRSSRMYFFPEGESIVEQLFNRRNRPKDELRKLINLALVEAGVPLEVARTVKARWSQYAGCSCPCSPGFLLHGISGKEFFVTIQMEFPKFQEVK